MVESNTTWKYDSQIDDDKDMQFLFIHIPKTGGTTFRYVLYNHFDETEVYPSHADLLSNGGSYVNQNTFLKNKNYLNKKILIGHYRIQLLDKLKNKKIKKLAFFRNPLDRILSKIKHIRSHNKMYIGQDVNIILEKNWKQIMYSQSMAMGFSEKDKNMKEVRTNIFDLDFIGITEYFDESIQLCNATFNWQLENIPRKNVIDQEIFSQLSDKSKVQIITHLTPELKTYKIAFNQFMRRCKKYNIELKSAEISF